MSKYNNDGIIYIQVYIGSIYESRSGPLIIGGSHGRDY